MTQVPSLVAVWPTFLCPLGQGDTTEQLVADAIAENDPEGHSEHASVAASEALNRPARHAVQ
jgi:hypothetical protein